MRERQSMGARPFPFRGAKRCETVCRLAAMINILRSWIYVNGTSAPVEHAWQLLVFRGD